MGSLKSLIMCYVLKHLVEQGLVYLEQYTKEKEDEIEAKVKELIPGDVFDQIGYDVVKSLLPKAFEAAHKLKDQALASACPVEEKQLVMATHEILKAA
jgi:hypothetical protein